MRVCRFATAVVFAAWMPLVSSAQYTVKKLVFKGAEPHKQAQLEAVAGLKPGQHISTKEMGEASQRIMDTGAFADIETTVDGPFSGVSVIFKLKTAPQGAFLPVSYENMVWFTPEERETELQRRVPLYGGKIPAGSTLQALIQTALTQMLAEKGVQAEVETTEEPSTERRPVPLIAYRVVKPKVVLQEIHLTGVSKEQAPAMQKIAQSLSGAPYRETFDRPLGTTLLQPYLDAGYIHAKLHGLTRTPTAVDAGGVKVGVNASVDAGDAFRVSSITWTGSDIFSAADFAKGNKLKPGDVASDSLLRLSYKPLVDAYLQRGYVDVSIDTHPVEDASAHTVSYTLSALPGEVYKIESLSVVGLSPQQRAQFDSMWKLPVGATYDGVYAFRFLPANAQSPLFRGVSGNVVTTAMPDTRLVDIVLTFAPVR